MSTVPQASLFHSHLSVFDGGVGTELYERGFYINRPFEELNTTHSRDVIGVHRSYIDSGAHFITTNTFSLPSPQLEKFDIVHRQAELLQAAIKNARTAVKEAATSDPSIGNVKVALSFGPMGVLIEPLGRTSKEEVIREYENLASAALALKDADHTFDLYTLETFSNIDELDCAIQGIRNKDPNHPIMASITCRSSELSLIQLFAQKIGGRSDVQALGMNCSEGPHELLQALKILKPLTVLPIIIQPNAGIPRNINGRYFYMTSPDYLAKFAKRFVEAGAQGVGGCCGTGPDHIRAIAQAIKMMDAKSLSPVAARFGSITADDSPGIESSGIHHHNRFKKESLQKRSRSLILKQFAENKKVITVELTSPKGTDLTKFLASLGKLKEAGVTFVNVPDGARASTRVSSLHLAAYVQSKPELGITVIPHLTARDRNLIALQADLLGASINQVHDLLLITGDPPKLGSNKDTTAVFDIDSIGLTYLTNRLNHGYSANGDELGSGTEFAIGVASNPTAINQELEIKRWQYKVESGADFAITQPIYEAKTFRAWKQKIGSNYRPHIVGIWPFVSYKNAEFMAHEVPGVFVPQWALEQMSEVQHDPAASVKKGVEIAVKLMNEIWNDCEGFAISAPLGRVEVVLEVLKCLPKK